MRIGFLNIRPEYETEQIEVFYYLPTSSDYLATYIKSKMPEVETFIHYDINKLMEDKPDIVAFSSFTRTYHLAKKYAKQIKQERPDIPIVIGGHHISSLPENLDINMDIGVIGEGEITFHEIIELFKENNLNSDNLSKVDGIIFRNNENQLKKTKLRELISNLDILPIPSRTRPDYVDGYWQEAIFTSRGCPFRCKYCSISEFWESIRYHSPERVIEELKSIIEKPNHPKRIIILDDLFGINKKRLKLLVEAIKAEGINKKVVFTCNARSSVFDEEIAQLFVDMNVKACVFGMESANDRILGYMKGSTTAKQNQKAIDICKKYGISATGNFIVGFPTETPDEAADTYWFVRKNSKDLPDFRVFPACPLPGTHLWEYAKSKGLVKETYEDWGDLDFFFEPEKSVYLNQDQYDKYQYKTMIDTFNELRENTKLLSIINGEESAKLNYCRRLQKNIIDSVKIRSDAKILEISGIGTNILGGLVNDYNNAFVFNGKIIIDDDDNKKFDVILINHSLEQLINPEETILCLKKKLSEDGKIIVSTYNPQNPMFLMRFLIGSDVYSDTWTKQEKDIVRVYVREIFKENSEDIDSLKKYLGENIFDHWILNSKNLSFYGVNDMNKIFEKTLLKIENTSNIEIKLDPKIEVIYKNIQELFIHLLGKKIMTETAFSKLYICNSNILYN
jgi:anaerobic magnesium-protoporphyrin IX monomethyl ester cyclase